MTSIQKNVQQAKATGDDKRYGQVASRKKVRQSRTTISANVYPQIFSFILETGKNGYGTS